MRTLLLALSLAIPAGDAPPLRTPIYEKPRISSAEGIYAISPAPDGETVAAATGRGAELWNIATADTERTLNHVGRVNTVAFDSLGRHLASGGQDRIIRLWNPWTKTSLHTLSGHSGPVLALAFNPGGENLASAGADRAVLLWEASTGRLLRTLTGHTGGVNAVAWSPDGSTLATGGDDETVRLWDPSTGKEKATLRGHRGWINSVAFHPGGDLLVSAGEDGFLRFWNLDTVKEARSLEAHPGGALRVVWSPDGNALASSGRNETVEIREAASGRILQTLRRHHDWVEGLAFTPDGRHLITGSRDRALRIWDVSTGRACETAPGPSPGTDLVPGLLLKGYPGRTDFSVLPEAQVPGRSPGYDPREGPLWSGGTTQDFEARWLGYLKVPRTGSYFLQVSSEDPVHVRLDGTAVIGRTATQKSAAPRLHAGLQPIEVLYLRGKGAGGFKLSISEIVSNIVGEQYRALGTDIFLHEREEACAAPDGTPSRHGDRTLQWEAEDFSGGRKPVEGRDFHDDTPGNLWREHRDADVDIKPTARIGRVVRLETGEWLAFSFEGEGEFEPSVLAAEIPPEGTRMQVEVDDRKVGGPLQPAKSTVVKGAKFRVAAGRHRVRLVMESGRADVDHLRFVALPAPPADDRIRLAEAALRERRPDLLPGTAGQDAGTRLRSLVRAIPPERDEAAVYVLLREARSLAAEAGEVSVASWLAQVTGRHFGFRNPSVLAEVIERTRTTAKTPVARKARVGLLLDLAQTERLTGNSESALRRLDEAAQEAQALEDADLSKAVEAQREPLRKTIEAKDRTAKAAAQWAEWTVSSGKDDSAPRILPNHLGRASVFMTHPVDPKTPATLERRLAVPATPKPALSAWVAPHRQGDWNLRILADGKLLHEEAIGVSRKAWKQVRIDLSAYSGREVQLRLENAPTGWQWEFGYWSDIEVLVGER